MSHPEVPLWRQHSIKSLAYHEHLYTRQLAAGKTTEVERWLGKEFETPADGAIDKVISGSRIYPEDWLKLVRFLAAQDARTPARMIESINRWDQTLEQRINEILSESVRELEEAHREGRKLQAKPHPWTAEFPSRVTTQIDPEAETGKLKVQVVQGRALWLFSLRHVLTGNAIDTLMGHRWTIFRAPKGMHWLTSDNPVIRLNYCAPGRYDFGGGWGSKGTEVFLPLSPQHLLYTKIGDRPRGGVLDEVTALRFQRVIVEHAHRFVFGAHPDASVAYIRPRTVDDDVFRAEADFWARWDKEQSTLEHGLLEQSAEKARPGKTSDR